MELQTVINIASVAFGAGGFLSSFVIYARVTTLIEKTRNEEREYMEKHFVRKPA